MSDVEPSGPQAQLTEVEEAAKLLSLICSRSCIVSKREKSLVILLCFLLGSLLRVFVVFESTVSQNFPLSAGGFGPSLR